MPADSDDFFLQLYVAELRQLDQLSADVDPQRVAAARADLTKRIETRRRELNLPT